MVTLRRDVAAAQDNRIFDSFTHDAENLTAYDVFMLEKKRSESQQKSSFQQASEEIERKFQKYESNYFSAPTKQVQEPKLAEKYSSYNEYMTAQLHRSAPEKILTEEEFLLEKFDGKVVAKSASKEKKAPRKLSRAGKIFVAVYVLIVAAVASIILALNAEYTPVNASATDTESAVAPLEIVEEDTAHTNWFDTFLDGLSNK